MGPGPRTSLNRTASGRSCDLRADGVRQERRRGGARRDRLGTEVVSADAMQAYRGLPILTNQPERPTRLVGIWPLEHEGSVGEYQQLAHADDRRARRRARVAPSSPAGQVSTCAPRSRSSTCRRRRPPASGSAGSASTTPIRRRRTRELAARDPARGAPCASSTTAGGSCARSSSPRRARPWRPAKIGSGARRRGYRR